MKVKSLIQGLASLPSSPESSRKVKGFAGFGRGTSVRSAGSEKTADPTVWSGGIVNGGFGKGRRRER